MKKIIVFALGVFISQLSMSRAAGLPVDEAEFTRLQEARSSAVVRDVRADFSRVRAHVAACDLQRREGVAPLACYSARWYAEALRLETSQALSLTELDRLCANATTRGSWLEMPKIPGISEFCTNKLRERIRQNRYKRGMTFEI